MTDFCSSGADSRLQSDVTPGVSRLQANYEGPTGGERRLLGGGVEDPDYAEPAPVPDNTYDSVPALLVAEADDTYAVPTDLASPAVVSLPIHVAAWLDHPAATQNDADADLAGAGLGFGSYCFRLASNGGLVSARLSPPCPPTRTRARHQPFCGP